MANQPLPQRARPPPPPRRRPIPAPAETPAEVHIPATPSRAAPPATQPRARYAHALTRPHRPELTPSRPQQAQHTHKTNPPESYLPNSHALARATSELRGSTEPLGSSPASTALPSRSLPEILPGTLWSMCGFICFLFC